MEIFLNLEEIFDVFNMVEVIKNHNMFWSILVSNSL